MVKKHVKKIMVPKIIEVQSNDFILKTSFETRDGKMFDDESTAERYEESLDFSKIEKIDLSNLGISFYDIGDFWYKPKDEKEADFLKQYFNYPNCYINGIEKIKAGEWFNFRYDDFGDSRPAVTIRSLVEFKEDIDRLFKVLS